MPDNRSVVLGSTGVIFVAALLRLWPADCPLQVNAAPQVSFTDAKWGTATNVTISHEKSGDLIKATPANGFHRLIKTVTVPVAGLYRISVETTFAGTSGFVMEVGGSRQPKYGLLAGDAKSGQIMTKIGDVLAAGVDVVHGNARHYRWWLEMNFVPGEAGYNFAMAAADSRLFPGNDGCKIVLNEPSFTAVAK